VDPGAVPGASTIDRSEAELRPGDPSGVTLRSVIKWGRNRLDTRGKDDPFARHGSAVIGPIYKCQRQSGTRCRCVSDKRGSGGTGQQKPPNISPHQTSGWHRHRVRAMERAMTDEQQTPVESLLPYDEWTEAAMRQVIVQALGHVAANGLPGEHHFYITFRTDHAGVVMPPRLRAQYPEEMTIVLQHQFWDLKIDEDSGLMSVGLSFGGVPSTLVIPLGAITAFADPYVRFGMRFRAEMPEPLRQAESGPATPSPEAAENPAEGPPQVVSLDAFRRRSPGKD
jgi:uncharacterized protein